MCHRRQKAFGCSAVREPPNRRTALLPNRRTAEGSFLELVPPLLEEPLAILSRPVQLVVHEVQLLQRRRTHGEAHVVPEGPFEVQIHDELDGVPAEHPIDELLSTIRIWAVLDQGDRTDIPAPGENILATLKLGVYLMRQGEFITEHEVKIGNKVAEVLCGGAVSPGTPVSEQYFLDLEREAFKSLCGEKKTQERIAFTLKTGKPLRN